MVIEVYNGWLAAPVKCGSRYLAKFGMNIVRSDVNGLRRVEGNPYLNLEWFVIRNPIEHLYSALHTECLPHFDNPIEVKRILDSFLEPYTGGTHYHMELYKRIWEFWCKSRYSFEFVELTRLSYVMDSKGYHYPYYPDDYKFGYYEDKWKSKDEVAEMVRDNFRKEWDILMGYAHTDLHYYENCQSRIKKFL